MIRPAFWDRVGVAVGRRLPNPENETAYKSNLGVSEVGPTHPSAFQQIRYRSTCRMNLCAVAVNSFCYVGQARTEDMAPQGCDQSAVSGAGMKRGGADRPAVLSILARKR